MKHHFILIFPSILIGLWLDYISMELKDGNPEVVGQLHWQAMKSLSGEKVEEFVTKYTLLKNSIES